MKKWEMKGNERKEDNTRTYFIRHDGTVSKFFKYLTTVCLQTEMARMLKLQLKGSLSYQEDRAKKKLKKIVLLSKGKT